MFVSEGVGSVIELARALLDRARHPRSRALELAALRRRLGQAPSRARVSKGEIEAALELRRLRAEMSAALSSVSSCSGCARGHPLPHGRWIGGHCCGCHTTQVFTGDEVAALRLSGTTPGALTPPRGDHAGCAFRGPVGCSLPLAHRPSICVRYVCHELEGELRARGDLHAIKAVATRLSNTLKRFSSLREQREQSAATVDESDELLAPLRARGGSHVAR